MVKKIVITVSTLLIVFDSLTALCAPPLSSQLELIIIPSEVTVTVGEQVQFRAEIKNNIGLSGGNIKWEVMGNIGEISSDGLFKAGEKPGRGMVRASVRVENKLLTAHALVKIAEGILPPGSKKQIVVTVRPESAIVSPGGTQKFSAEPFGNTIWRVVPPRLGSIDPGGLFSASHNAGRGIVIATVQTADGTGTGRASVTVSGGKIVTPPSELKVNIKPKHAQVNPGGSTPLAVEVIGLKIQYSLEWQVNPEKLGRIVRTGDRAEFIAGDTEGRALVMVTVRTEAEIGMDWAIVDVGRPGKGSPSKLKIAVMPQDATVKVGDSMLFTADTTGQVSWSVVPKKIGTISGDGLFTANSPGWGLVIARVNTGKADGLGQAKVFVSSETRTPVKITISPQKAETNVGGKPVKFTAQIADIQGRTLTDVPVQWKVVPSDLGSIDQTGLFSPGNKAGHALITAKVEGVGMAQARVTIASKAQIRKLIVTLTGPESLKVGSSGTYSAEVTMSDGSKIQPGELEFQWRVAPSKLGTLTWTGANATFVPSMAGRGVIIVEVKSAQGTGTARISVKISS